MKKTLSILTVFVSLTLLTACESASHFSGDRAQLVAAPDRVSSMLADAATRASSALETLAAVEYSKAPNANLSPIGDAPPPLRRAITVNWVGPVGPITKTLADRASYVFLTIGSEPAVPVVVSVDAENSPVIDVLRDIGLQLGKRANIVVDGERRVVEIHYPANTGPSS